MENIEMFILVFIALTIAITFYTLTFMLLYAVYQQHRESVERFHKGEEVCKV